jgi:Flp pilus assembly protein TadG
MTASQQDVSVSTNAVADESGQALVEFAAIAPLLFILLFGIIDFGRAIYDMQLMTGLTRQGSNLASRGTDLPTTVASVIAGDAPLDLNNNGEVIVTSVTNTGGVFKISGQLSQGAVTARSKIGVGVGNTATLPAAAATILQPNQTIYVTEVYYSYQPITPIGNMLKIALPSALYEVAYF